MGNIIWLKIKRIVYWLAGAWLIPRITLAKLIDTNEINAQAEMLRTESGYEAGVELGGVISYIIEGFLAVLSIIFIIIIIIAGYDWMTAGGEEEKVDKAKNMIKRAIIGLLIIVAAYAITYFVFNHLPGGNNTSFIPAAAN